MGWLGLRDGSVRYYNFFLGRGVFAYPIRRCANEVLASGVGKTLGLDPPPRALHRCRKGS